MPTVEPPVSKISFDNWARNVAIKRQGQDWYKWRVFVSEPNQVIQQIDAVEYLLHHTFPDPLRRRTNPADKFALESAGWGEFDIYITVFFKNGSRLETSYYLNLSKPWP